MKDNKNHKTPDSSAESITPTVVTVALGGVRKRTSVYLDRKLWNNFISLLKKEGLSSCDILEKLILGFLTGYEYGYLRGTNIQVSVDAPRVVKRVRRRQLVFEGGVEGEDPDGSVDKYLQDGNCWTTVSRADGVNEYSHGDGCECSWCRS